MREGAQAPLGSQLARGAHETLRKVLHGFKCQPLTHCAGLVLRIGCVGQPQISWSCGADQILCVTDRYHPTRDGSWNRALKPRVEY